VLHTIKRGAFCNGVTLKQAISIAKQHDVKKTAGIVKQRVMKLSNMNYTTT
jgi:hypothetical protein